MKANIKIDLKTAIPSEAQRLLLNVFENWKKDGIIKEYHFALDTPNGIVTEICVLENEKVIA